MKGSHSLFVLTIFLSPKSSNGETSFLGAQKRALFQSAIDRGIGSHQRRLRHLLRFRGEKRARSASTSNLTRNMIQDNLVKNESNLPTGTHKGVAHLKSLQGMRRKRFKWFQFPKVSRETIERFAFISRYFLLGLIGFELVLILRDIFREIFTDIQDLSYDEDAIRGSSRKVLSRNSVEKLIAWLEKPEDRRPTPPSTIGPVWLITLAQELCKCTQLSLAEVREILLQLTNAEAKLLQLCLLSSNNKVDFTDIGGLFNAKRLITQLLMSSLSDSKMLSPSSINKSSPYDEMISKGNGRHNMVLWGPPGSGKSLLIRAIAKNSGLPTLVISPILIQNYHNLEILFSLVSTLGSCVVVLDDLDGLFPSHRNEDHGVTKEIKNELLRWWDGVASYSTRCASKECVFLVAATSRPWDVDTAAWRRLQNRIYIGLPNSEDRYDILKKVSKDLPPIEESVLQYFVSVSEGLIPLDLHQFLVYACQNGPMSRQDTALTIEDVHVARSTILPTRYSAQYIQQLQSFISLNISSSESSTTQSQTQQPSSISGAQDYFSPYVIQSFPVCENGYCWETALGTFYQFQIPVDSEVLAAIQTILLFSFEWSSSDDWDFSDDDDDDYHFDKRDDE
jgi:ATP-dependent 26S proteasome regulatory subunit